MAAQEPSYWQLTEEDGLPSMTVYQIHQDKKGFMWFGTENGICRYDGKEIKTFYHPDLLDNEILKIQEDGWGRVWFMNLAGQLGVVEEEIRVIKIEEDFKLKEFVIGNNQLLGMFASPTRRLLLYTIQKNGHLITQSLSIFKNSYTVLNLTHRDNTAYVLFRKKKGKSVVTTFLCTYDFKKQIEKIYQVKDLEPYPGRDFFSINKNELALQVKSELLRFKIGRDSVISIRKEPYTLLSDYIRWEGKQFFIGQNGVEFLEKKNKSILRNFKINNAFIDHERNLWLVTLKNGILIIPSFKLKYFNKDNSNLPSNNPFFISPSHDNRLLMGHDDGKISIIENDEIISKKLNPSGRIRSVAIDSKKRIWLGGDAFPITILSNELKKLKTLVYPSKFQTVDKIRNNIIWIGNNNYTMGLDIDSIFSDTSSKKYEYQRNHSFKDMKTNASFSFLKLILKGRTYSIFQENTPSKIWLGTSKGLYQYKNKETSPFLENNQHIPYSISSITQSNDSTIWVATQGHGLLGIKNDSIIHRINEESGLTTNNCNTLFYDEFNNLWIGTKKGLHQLNLNTFELETINKYDGLPTDEISALYAKDSTLWIGTPKGLVKMHYSAIKKNIAPPPIHITGVKLWEKDTIIQSTYDLKHNQNNFNIEFVGLTYRNRGNTNYQYRMIGVDTNWVSTTTRFARYPLLPPGQYEFQVKAINEDNIESIEPASIQLKINRPWWTTWWFYTLAIIGSISLIGTIFYRRYQRIRKEEKQQRELEKQQQEFNEKINELRMMALQSQMNPHFVFNALSAIQKFLTTNEQEHAMLYLAKFAQLIRNIFEHSKEKLITLEEELNFLKLYLDLEQLRFKEKIEIDFKIDQSISEDDYDLQIPPLLIQPIIENAFKHGLMHREINGVLKINFSRNDEFLFCLIEDNGVGRMKAKELGEALLKRQRPSGLTTAKERLDILNKTLQSENNLKVEDLCDDKKNAIGTRVNIKIKFNNFN